MKTPLVVSGDPKRRSGLILAASVETKAYGVKNAKRLWEAQQKCIDLFAVPLTCKNILMGPCDRPLSDFDTHGTHI